MKNARDPDLAYYQAIKDFLERTPFSEDALTALDNLAQYHERCTGGEIQHEAAQRIVDEFEHVFPDHQDCDGPVVYIHEPTKDMPTYSRALPFKTNGVLCVITHSMIADGIAPEISTICDKLADLIIHHFRNTFGQIPNVDTPMFWREKPNFYAWKEHIERSIKVALWFRWIADIDPWPYRSELFQDIGALTPANEVTWDLLDSLERPA